MRKFVTVLFLGLAASVPGPLMAQYVLPPGYTQLMCTAQFRDNYVRYAIFQTKTVELAKLDWQAFATQFGRPSGAECSAYPNSDSARARMKEREANSPRLKFEPLAWSPNSERLTMRPDWRPDGGGSSSSANKPSREASTPSRTSTPAPVTQSVKGPTPNQLKYQRELEAYKARLAEIERIKAAIVSKHLADSAAAKREIARHRQELATADAAQRRYQEDLAAHQRQVADLETKRDRELKVDWREAVVVCNLDANDGQSRFGNWRCDGPLQITYAKLGSAGTAPDTQAIISLSQACGGNREAVRDLGMVGAAHLFGCSFGLHPKSTSGFPRDAAAQHGISFVPGRAIYRCPEWKSACRTQ